MLSLCTEVSAQHCNKTFSLVCLMRYNISTSADSCKDERREIHSSARRHQAQVGAGTGKSFHRYIERLTTSGKLMYFKYHLVATRNHYWTYWMRFLQEAIHPFPSFWSFWRTAKELQKWLCRREQLQDKIPTKPPSSLHWMTCINAVAFCKSTLWDRLFRYSILDW